MRIRPPVDPRVAAALLLALGCEDGEGADSCTDLCGYVATCQSPCDYEEEPDCNEQQRYDEIFTFCTEACRSGLVDRASCPPASQRYADCVSSRSCDAADLDACAEDSRRYQELCVTHAGAQLCATFCAELRSGCMSYANFGLRGPDCIDVCEATAEDTGCLESLYDLDGCTQGSGYGCDRLPPDCDDEVRGVQTRCAGFEPTLVDPNEQALCESAAPEQCRCGLWSADDCIELAEDRCLFDLGYGLECRSAIEGLDACMRDIATCNRDVLREECKERWQAYGAECGG